MTPVTDDFVDEQDNRIVIVIHALGANIVSLQIRNEDVINTFYLTEEQFDHLRRAMNIYAEE